MTGAHAERGPTRSGGASSTAGRIDRYVLLRELGGGGMGLVYAAYDEHLDRKVALKVLGEGDARPSAQTRLLREAQALARLSHPNVVAIHDVGTSRGQVFMAMEFVAGVTLRSWLAAAPRSQKAIIDVFVEAGRGLAAAHAAGIVHRDFKPDNVMVGNDGRVRVTDFGLARPTGASDEHMINFAAAAAHEALGERGGVTATGTILGTPGYMSPEQHMGRPADARTDIYSFSASLYEAFFGQRPFAGETHADLANAAIRGELRPPPRGVVSPALRKVILRGLDVDPAARWPSMEALLGALTDDPIRRRRRIALLSAAAIAAIALVISAPLAITRLYERWQSERREAAAEARWRTSADQIEVLASLGRDDEAERVFQAFADAPETRGTRALTRAWLERGERALAGRALDAANAAFAQAYTNASDDALAGDALVALASLAYQRREWSALATLLEALAEGDHDERPEAAALDLRRAIAGRDTEGAAAILAAHGDALPAELRAAAPAAAAVTTGRRIGYRIAELTLADTDGDGERELLVLTADRRSVAILDRDLRLLAQLNAPEGHVNADLIADRPWVFTYRDHTLHLHRIGDTLDELWRAPAGAWSYSTVAADLDQSGADELYVGLAAYRRGLHVARDPLSPSARLEVADLATDRSASDVNHLIAADLDRDGRPELIAALGPWWAYDLRIFQDEGGDLRLVDRLQLGNIESVAVLRGPGGEPLLAAVKDDRWPDRRVFPTPPHTGEPAGVYLFAFDGRALERRGYIDPLAGQESGPAVFQGTLVAGDIDGDGLDDLALSAGKGDEALDRALVILRQGAEGFAAAQIVGLRLIGALDIDDDPNLELVVHDRSDGNSFWILGAGDEPLPRLFAGAPTPPPPPAIRDASARESWRRAERLAAIGERATAAESLHTAAVVADSLAERGPLEARAAELFAAAGDDLRAIELYRQLAAAPDAGPELRAAAARSYVRLGRFDEALAAIKSADGDAELALPDHLLPGDLERLTDEHRQLRVGFDAPLDPRWEILDPIALRRDPSGDALVINASNRPGPLARLPIEWEGGPLALRVELSVLHSEFAGTVDVTIRGGADQRIAGFAVSARGGGGLYSHNVGCVTEDQTLGSIVVDHPLARIDERLDLELDVTAVPGRAATCRVRGGQAVDASMPDELPPGPYSIVIGNGDRDDDSTTSMVVALRQIRLRGARIAAAGRGGSPAARALVDGDLDAVLSALGDDARGEALLWRALALLRVSDLEGCRRALAAALARDPTPPAERADLRRLVRQHPELGPLLQLELGPAQNELLAAAWSALLFHHADDPFTVQALTEGFEGLRPEASGDPSVAFLLMARGRAWRIIGELDRARRDLEAAARITEAGATDEETRYQLALALARLHVDLGDEASARAHLLEAIESARAPELARERLARYPKLHGLLAPASAGPDAAGPAGGIHSSP
ncbi:MAG: serine/threonine protein kinase [Myxococcales bacterium]|nr:serine/threonine protein kinase [Myxococcales bacterium]